MGSETTIDEEEAYVKETKLLNGMDIKDRNEYVLGVLKALSETVTVTMNEKNKIKQARKWAGIQKEMKEGKGEEILVCALYAIKKEYRSLFVNLMAVITGIGNSVNMPENKS